MIPQMELPFVDTTIIPDRNAGVGSLLLDLQNPTYPDNCESPLLRPEFAFIDVGVSRANVSNSLRKLLVRDLKMDVHYVATQRQVSVPYAYVTNLGNRAERIRYSLSRMISLQATAHEVNDWHYVIDYNGKVTSLAYSYNLYGNEVWESYFLGRAFMISGKKVEFCDPALDEILFPDIQKIEENIDFGKKTNSGILPYGHFLDEYRIEINPLEATLEEYGITLQKTDVPQRIMDRQNVLFLGNVLNHYPKEEQASELDIITDNLQEGDIVIIQSDEMEEASIEVLEVKRHGILKALERVRLINTIKLEIIMSVRGYGSLQQINLKPVLGNIVTRFIDCLGRSANFNEGNQDKNKFLVRQYINQVFGTFFRALPVEKTLCIAIREAIKRLPHGDVLRGIPVFRNDKIDTYGNPLGLDPVPIVLEADFSDMMVAIENAVRSMDYNMQSIKSENQQKEY